MVIGTERYGTEKDGGGLSPDDEFGMVRCTDGAVFFSSWKRGDRAFKGLNRVLYCTVPYRQRRKTSSAPSGSEISVNNLISHLWDSGRLRACPASVSEHDVRMVRSVSPGASGASLRAEQLIRPCDGSSRGVDGR